VSLNMDNSSQLTQAQRLNQHCACITLDRPAIISHLASQLGEDSGGALSAPAWKQFFSEVAVFVPGQELDDMLSIVRAIEAAAELPDYRRQVLSWARPSAQQNPGQSGVFMGYDFHLGEEGQRLIEVNTNAGGAFLNAALARAQLNCCDGYPRPPWAENFDAAVIAQFIGEWSAQRGGGRPERIAIVDDEPEEQYLYPEFRLAQQLLEAHGIDAVILSPAELTYASGVLCAGNKRIDLVYNRLVDFGLEAPEHAALRAAWNDGGAVITPNPYTHALFADKRNFSIGAYPPNTPMCCIVAFRALCWSLPATQRSFGCSDDSGSSNRWRAMAAKGPIGAVNSPKVHSPEFSIASTLLKPMCRPPNAWCWLMGSVKCSRWTCACIPIAERRCWLQQGSIAGKPPIFVRLAVGSLRCSSWAECSWWPSIRKIVGWHLCGRARCMVG
jgi:hypothetical protein